MWCISLSRWYTPIKNVPIVQTKTAYQSPYTGQVYILILNEALWMGYSIQQLLINSNQMILFKGIVLDSPISNTPMHITTKYYKFNLELKIQSVTIFAETHIPTDLELHNCPHLILTSPHGWNPHDINFNNSVRSSEQNINQLYDVNLVRCNTSDVLFNIGTINSKIINSVLVPNINIKYNISSINDNIPIERNPEKTSDICTNDILIPNWSQSSKRHSNILVEDLSDKWYISIAQVAKILNDTTQNFLRSALLPLSRSYKVDRMYLSKTLIRKWSTDTLHGRTKSLHGNRYAQVYANKGYFTKRMFILSLFYVMINLVLKKTRFWTKKKWNMSYIGSSVGSKVLVCPNYFIFLIFPSWGLIRLLRFHCRGVFYVCILSY